MELLTERALQIRVFNNRKLRIGTATNVIIFGKFWQWSCSWSRRLCCRDTGSRCTCSPTGTSCDIGRSAFSFQIIHFLPKRPKEECSADEKKNNNNLHRRS